jgi:23S rRNA pseudouridine1911/1915/1917 synthase
VPEAKKAALTYKTIAHSDTYYLLEINLETGRHHQIRCQLAKMGCPIKGDLKYGFARSNPNGGISLHARHIAFTHPVSQIAIDLTAPVPEDDILWQTMEALVSAK